jgi:hypothetical protein
VAVVWVLAGTAVNAYAFRNGWTWADLPAFAAAGRIMFSAGWRHTYDNPFFQAGPFELALAAVFQWFAHFSRGCSRSSAMSRLRRRSLRSRVRFSAAVRS